MKPSQILDLVRAAEHFKGPYPDDPRLSSVAKAVAATPSSAFERNGTLVVPEDLKDQMAFLENSPAVREWIADQRTEPWGSRDRPYVSSFAASMTQ